MALIKYKVTDSFFASNDHGTYYLIIEVTYLIRETEKSNWKKLFINYKTYDGMKVVVKEPGFFEIVPIRSLVKKVI